MGRLTRVGFEMAAHTRLRKYLYYRYDYSFDPQQLCFLVGCLNRTSQVPGAVLEVGCAYGHTTVFLNKHMDATGDTRSYICIDTFQGFTRSDSAFEEEERGKRCGEYRDRYRDADLRTFQRTMANNGVTRASPVKSDISLWKPETTQVSFCLIDVDLYKPVEAALEKIVPLVQPGGIVVVDDCQNHPIWDGALQAYSEFTARARIPPRVVEGKLGLIEVAG